MEPAGATAAPDHGTGTPPELPPPEEKETRPALPSRPNMAARHAKRLTLNFPIAPPNLQSEQSSPVVVAAGTPATESPRMMSPGQSLPDALTPGEEVSDPADLLTAIASQERKVLELREELQKAEVELTSLKKKWVLSERHKKQTEISHRAEAMRPLRPTTDGPGDESPNASENPSSTGTVTPTDPVSTQIRRSKELERRNSVRNGPKGDVSVSANGRRVFAGSKHTRTLSLLSPDMGVVRPPFPMKTDSMQMASNETQTTRHPRSATLPSVERVEPAKSSVEQSDDLTQDASGNPWRRSLPPPSSEALLRTGRQMASDLREGLWTFLEDIRQATVGEEAMSATRAQTLQPPASTTQRSRSGQRSERSVTPVRRHEQNGAFGRTNSSSSLSKEASKKAGNKISSPADTEVSFWSEFGVDTPGQKLEMNQAAVNTQNGQKESEQPHADPTNLDVEDDWSSWDTPQPVKKSHTPSSSQSTLTSKNDQSPSTQLSSPRTSASFGDRRSTDEGGRHRKDSSGIPWPALSKFAASQLTRTASSLMDEWEKSLTSSSSSSSSPSPAPSSSTSNKSDFIKTAQQKEHDEWEAF